VNNAIAEGKSTLKGRTAFLVACLLIFLTLMSLALYTFAHEGGHALAGLLFGGKITSFSVNFFDLSAHAGIDGQFSNPQRAAISAAGISLPILLCMGFLFLDRRQDNSVFFYFKSLLFLITVNSILAWIVIPLVAMTGRTIGDDSFNFLNYTRLWPPVLTAGALLVYLFCWALLFSRMGGVKAWINRFRSAAPGLLLPDSRKSIRTLAGFGMIVLAASAGLTLAAPDTTFSVPAGYQQVAVLDLSEGSLSNQSVYQFTLDAPASVGLYILLTDIQGAPLNIHLAGPSGYQSVFLDMTDPATDIGKASVSPEEKLFEKGDYEILMTLPSCRGKSSVYIKIDGL
jgi:hypothetical protein